MAVSVPGIGHSLVWLVRDLWPPKQMSCIIISSMGTPSAGWHIICHRCQHNAIRIFLISSQLVLLFHNVSQLSQLFTTVLFHHFLAKHSIHQMSSLSTSALRNSTANQTTEVQTTLKYDWHWPNIFVVGRANHLFVNDLVLHSINCVTRQLCNLSKVTVMCELCNCHHRSQLV